MSDPKTPRTNADGNEAKPEQAELTNESLDTVAGGQTNCFPDHPTEPDLFEIEITPTIKLLP